MSTYVGGAPLSASSAFNIAADAVGNVYFSNGNGYIAVASKSNSVFKIDSNDKVTCIAGNPRTRFGGDGGPPTSTTLFSPRGMAVDNAGNAWRERFLRTGSYGRFQTSGARRRMGGRVLCGLG